MDYITEILGTTVKREKWQDLNKLPYFVRKEYAFEKVTIDHIDCLFMKPLGEIGTITAIKKHLKSIQMVSRLPIVFDLASMSRQRRKSFIDARFPFVVPNKQVYLPFLGISLQESFDSMSGKPVLEKLQPSAQMLLFYIIYRGVKTLYIDDATKQFEFSAMTISRAANQLVKIGLVGEYKDGVNRVLRSDLSSKELFEKSKPYLINPVRRKVYMDTLRVNNEFFDAGLTALPEGSLVNSSLLKVFGTSNSLKADMTCDELVDTETQCEVEIWKYDPRVISNDNEVDVLSLVLSLADHRDEHIEKIIEGLLNELWENIDSLKNLLVARKSQRMTSRGQ